MNRASTYLTARLLGLYRSRTIRLLCYGALLWIPASYAVRHGWFPAAILGQIDPVILQSAAFRLTFGVLAAVAVQEVLAVFDNRAGVQFRTEWLPELRAGNIAIAIYLGARFVGVCLLIGWALG